MATAVVIAATPDMLRYLVTGASGEGTDSVDIDQEGLVEQCAAGPLQSLFRAPLFDNQQGVGHTPTWSNLFRDTRLSVTLAGYGASPSIHNSYNFRINSINVLTIGCDLAAGLIVELRFNHSINR